MISILLISPPLKKFYYLFISVLFTLGSFQFHLHVCWWLFPSTLFQSYSSLSSSFYACTFHSQKCIIKFYNVCGKIFSSNFPLICGIIFLVNAFHLPLVFPVSFILPIFWGATSTCFVVLNFVYLPISSLKVEFQRNLCCLFSLLLLETLYEEKGEMPTWWCHLQSRSYPACSLTFYLEKFET